MTAFAHLAQRIFNRPLMILPEKAEIIMAALRERLQIGAIVAPDGKVMAYGDYDYDAPADPVRYYDVIQGAAIIPVSGTLVQKSGTMRPWSGMTGYDGIAANFAQAMNDPEVKGIVFDIDSPGGEVAGCFDLVDMIVQARGQKPMRAHLSEIAYSAAYAIASATDLITVPRTGGTGSIGVITLHVDMSRMLDKEGYTVTIIANGAHKTDGNPYQPLPDDVRARVQSEIDMVADLFVDTIAANRDMAATAVRGTEAGKLIGDAGVKVGFADAVAAPDVALAEFIRSLNA